MLPRRGDYHAVHHSQFLLNNPSFVFRGCTLDVKGGDAGEGEGDEGRGIKGGEERG